MISIFTAPQPITLCYHCIPLLNKSLNNVYPEVTISHWTMFIHMPVSAKDSKMRVICSGLSKDFIRNLQKMGLDCMWQSPGWTSERGSRLHGVLAWCPFSPNFPASNSPALSRNGVVYVPYGSLDLSPALGADLTWPSPLIWFSFSISGQDAQWPVDGRQCRGGIWESFLPHFKRHMISWRKSFWCFLA